MSEGYWWNASVAPLGSISVPKTTLRPLPSLTLLVDIEPTFPACADTTNFLISIPGNLYFSAGDFDIPCPEIVYAIRYCPFGIFEVFTLIMANPLASVVSPGASSFVRITSWKSGEYQVSLVTFTLTPGMPLVVPGYCTMNGILSAFPSSNVPSHMPSKPAWWLVNAIL